MFINMKNRLYCFIILVLGAKTFIQAQNTDVDVMILPSKLWCERFDAVGTVTINGVEETYIDYDKAINSPEVEEKAKISLFTVTSEITSTFQSKGVDGFTFSNIGQKLDNAKWGEAFIATLSPEQKQGKEIFETPAQKLLSAVKPEVLIEFDYKAERQGMGGTYYLVTLYVINPSTSEVIATKVARSDVKGNGIPIDMIIEAVGKIVFEVVDVIREYDADRRENGQRISFEAVVLRDDLSDFSLKYSCSEFDLSVKDLIQSYMEAYTVNANFSAPKGTGTSNVIYPYIRVPVEKEEVNPITGKKIISKYRPQDFANDIAKFFNDKCAGIEVSQEDKGLVSFITISPKGE